MSKLQYVNDYLGQVGTGVYLFHCPGCKDDHFFRTSSLIGPVWFFDGSFNRPTFSPSLKITGFRAPDPEFPTKGARYICHLFLRDGKIQYCNDSTHDLAGKTFDCPEW